MSTDLRSALMAELEDCCRCTAAFLSNATGAHLDDVYEELVRLEGEGLARVIVDHDGDRRCKYWQAV